MTSPEGGEPRLVVSDLACERGGRLLFQGLSVSLNAGEALIVEGPNGSGKSSLLRIMAGLLAPTAGRISWRGLDTRLEPQPWRREMVFLGHLNAVKRTLTVRENLAFLGCDGSPGLRESLNLEGLDHLPAAMLSAGQVRRLALARVAARPGGCWILDEPAASLDADSTARLDELIAAHRARGGIAVLSAHALDEAQTVRLGTCP
ncbi:MAG: heme ABC exporter ATP-binding protein CcmA [bacterium]|nr:heme ABC exporter ATP-binding protein CcmA [bacterium]